MSLIAGNLGVIQRLLDGDRIIWGVCAGAAAHLYGNRRPLQDVDILVAPGKLPDVVKLLQGQNKVVQFDGQRILWRGIKLFDDLTIKRSGVTFPFVIDEAMSARLRRIALLGAPVPVLPPEDIVLHKLMLDRGAEQGKHDRSDAMHIAKRQKLDLDYLRHRMQAMRVNGMATAALAELGINV